MEYKILEAYRNNKNMGIQIAEGIAGSLLFIIGIVEDKLSYVIGGSAAMSLATASYFFEYAKAYMEARLDYMKNNKFTRLEKEVNISEDIESIKP